MTQLRDLARRFPTSVIHTNPSGGGVYVSHHLYVQRLLMHLGGYSFERVDILRGKVAGKPPNPNGSSQRAKEGTPDLEDAVVGVVCRLTVNVDGQTMVIEDVGDCESPHNWPHDGARLKDAMSDALKRCCARIGLGTHLYSKTEDDYVLYRVLTDQEQASGVGVSTVSTGGTGSPQIAGDGTRDPAPDFAAGPSGGGEVSGQTLVAGNPAGESKDPTPPAHPSLAPPEFCDACKAGDCQHCVEHVNHLDFDGSPEFCDCPHDDGRPM